MNSEGFGIVYIPLKACVMGHIYIYIYIDGQMYGEALDGENAQSD